MTHCWQFNTIFTLVVYCLFLHGKLHGYVAALSSDTHDTGEKENADPLSMPLINDDGAPLVAMLDTNTINMKIKSYIKTLMRNMIQNSMQEEMQGISSPPIAKYKDCTELKKKTNKKLNDGVYKIYPGGDNPVQAYCDMSTDGGGWTVMLKRFGGSVSFKRTWVECENGFDDINGEFWLGNKYTHMLTSSGKYELRVDMVDRYNNNKYGDQFKYHNGMKFTTVDQDNDIYSKNCADADTGSWWYYYCHSCDLTRTQYKPYWGGTISKPEKYKVTDLFDKNIYIISFIFDEY